MAGHKGGGGSKDVAATVVVLLILMTLVVVVEGRSWCIARNNASTTALQTALIYACQVGADCRPLQPAGSCYLPNTVLSHASYAFNSFYQRNHKAPGTCDFSGTARVTIIDPSFGSCKYPSSASNVGGAGPMPTSATPNPNTPITLNNTSSSFSSNGGSGGLMPPVSDLIRA